MNYSTCYLKWASFDCYTCLLSVQLLLSKSKYPLHITKVSKELGRKLNSFFLWVWLSYIAKSGQRRYVAWRIENGEKFGVIK